MFIVHHYGTMIILHASSYSLFKKNFENFKQNSGMSTDSPSNVLIQNKTNCSKHFIFTEFLGNSSSTVQNTETLWPDTLSFFDDLNISLCGIGSSFLQSNAFLNSLIQKMGMSGSKEGYTARLPAVKFARCPVCTSNNGIVTSRLTGTYIMKKGRRVWKDMFETIQGGWTHLESQCNKQLSVQFNGFLTHHVASFLYFYIYVHCAEKNSCKTTTLQHHFGISSSLSVLQWSEHKQQEAWGPRTSRSFVRSLRSSSTSQL